MLWDVLYAFGRNVFGLDCKHRSPTILRAHVCWFCCFQVLEEKEERAQQGTLLGTSHTYAFDFLDGFSFLCQHFLLTYLMSHIHI